MNLPQTIRILSRKSDLAIIQARQVGNKIFEQFPNVKIEYISKKTSGDIDLVTPLEEMSSAGVFTDDLRNDLIANECARKIIDISNNSLKPIGFGILTCENLEQAINRSDIRKKNKGREAANACIKLL